MLFKQALKRSDFISQSSTQMNIKAALFFWKELRSHTACCRRSPPQPGTAIKAGPAVQTTEGLRQKPFSCTHRTRRSGSALPYAAGAGGGVAWELTLQETSLPAGGRPAMLSGKHSVLSILCESLQESSLRQNRLFSSGNKFYGDNNIFLRLSFLNYL